MEKWLTAFLVVVVFYCGTCTALDNAADVAEAPPRRTLDFNILHVQGSFAPGVPTLIVIRDSVTWAKFQRERSIKGPGIDFNRYTLVVVATKAKGSAGYAVVVSSVDDMPKERNAYEPRITQVSALDFGPGSCPRLPEMARPAATFVLIPKINQQVRLAILIAGLDCTDSNMMSLMDEAIPETNLSD